MAFQNNAFEFHAFKRTLTPAITQLILDGRVIVEQYRADHAALYINNQSPDTIPYQHTPLIDQLRAGLDIKEFFDLQDFFNWDNLLKSEGG